MALSYAIVTTMLVHPQLAVATVQSPVTASDVYKVIFRPLCLSMFIAIGMVLARFFFSDGNPVWSVLVSVMGGSLILAISFYFWMSINVDLREIYAMLDSLRPRRMPLEKV